MSATMTPRERLLHALRCEPVDYVPCAFMSFAAMRNRCQDAFETVEREIELGLDAWLFVPTSWRHERRAHPDLRGLPVRLSADVRTDLWQEDDPAQRFPVLHRAYHTAAGTLTTAVLKTTDWPHGNTVPLFDDYQIPRALKRLVTGPADLPALRALLRPPDHEVIAAYRAEAAGARAFCDAHGVMMAGGWGVGADMVAWLCGLEEMVLLAVDDPAFLRALLDTICTWSRQRMDVVLHGGVDLFIRRGWYESTDFFTPAHFRDLILPDLRRDAALAHERGALLAYIMTTGIPPLAEMIRDAGVDVLIGVDPLQRGDPLAALRDRLGGRVCLWGGVNGALSVEVGTADDTRSAVRRALETMRGVNGFVLSPIDNVTDITLNAWRNVDVLVETWRALR